MRRNRDLNELGILDLTAIVPRDGVRNLGSYENAKKILESVGLGDLITNPESGSAITYLSNFDFHFIKAFVPGIDKFEEIIIPFQNQKNQKAEGIFETIQFGGYSEQDQEFTTFVAINYFYETKTYEIGLAEN